jgi:hypothetical protein
MKYLKLIGSFGLILILLVINLNSAAFPHRIISNQSNREDIAELPKITINRIYIIAEVSGEIVIKDKCNFTKLIFNHYINLDMNGTVINSTFLNPFCIWPPISWIPGLRMIILPDNSSVHIKIKWFKGSLFTRNNGTSYALMGMGFFIWTRATIDINKIIQTTKLL